jgi:hypothetical protein
VGPVPAILRTESSSARCPSHVTVDGDLSRSRADYQPLLGPIPMDLQVASMASSCVRKPFVSLFVASVFMVVAAWRRAALLEFSPALITAWACSEVLRWRASTIALTAVQVAPSAAVCGTVVWDVVLWDTELVPLVHAPSVSPATRETASSACRRSIIEPRRPDLSSRPSR